MPFYKLMRNPLIVRGHMKNWKVTRFGHASKRRVDTKTNDGIRDSLNRNRITV